MFLTAHCVHSKAGRRITIHSTLPTIPREPHT